MPDQKVIIGIKPKKTRVHAVKVEVGHSRYKPWLGVMILSLLAAVRIFFFSAAFPFFSNVDEHAHFDLIWKYAHGQWPAKGNETVAPQTFRQMMLFGSPEFGRKAGDFPNGEIPTPVAVWPKDQRTKLESSLQNNLYNHEEYSPPLYYWLAGCWFRFGQGLGLENAGLLYWTRFFNIPIYLCLMVMIYVSGRQIFPHSPERVWCLMLLAALIPQDVFYNLNSDVLSPVLGTAFFLMLYHCMTRPHVPWYIFAALGMTLALSLLVKLSNLPLAAIAVAAVAMTAWQKKLVRPDIAVVAKIVIAIICLAVPISIWVLHNISVTGDWSGSKPKIEYLGWTSKALTDLWSHPIFTLKGLSYFIYGLFSTFWRGELVWHLRPITYPWLDVGYALSTTLFIAVSAFFGIRGLIKQRENAVEVLSLIAIVAVIGFMAALSVMFDFHDCWYPSQEKPFLISGRLMLGAFLPFLICYAYGLQCLLALIRLERYTPHVIMVFMGIVTVAEIWLTLPAVSSQYNFFHIPLGSI